jgi:hypothetical protein
MIVIGPDPNGSGSIGHAYMACAMAGCSVVDVFSIGAFVSVEVFWFGTTSAGFTTGAADRQAFRR